MRKGSRDELHRKAIIKDGLEKNKSMKQVAYEIGINQGTLSTWLTRRGTSWPQLATLQEKKKDKERLQYVQEGIMAGKTAKEIAKGLGLSYYLFSKWGHGISGGRGNLRAHLMARKKVGDL